MNSRIAMFVVLTLGFGTSCASTLAERKRQKKQVIIIGSVALATAAIGLLLFHPGSDRCDDRTGYCPGDSEPDIPLPGE